VTSDNKLDLTASLLPPTHVALIPRSRLVHHIGQAFEHLNKNKNSPPRAVAFISGPSKTADIQLTIVHGVHVRVRPTP
jgi:L-lactate dehydrogenase complex protein LldG